MKLKNMLSNSTVDPKKVFNASHYEKFRSPGVRIRRMAS
jgi:hypothetical protein